MTPGARSSCAGGSRRRTATIGATLAALAGLVRDADASSARAGTVGIGTPGSISRATGLLRGCNSVCLNGQPFKRDLEAELGREVRVTNDANCFALSEATDGAGAGRRRRLRRDPRHRRRRRHRRARPRARRAERHRRRVGPQPAALARGRRAAGPRVLLRAVGLHRDLAVRPRHRARSPAPRPASRLAAKDIAARAAIGDAACAATLARYEERFARAIAHVINVLDPDVIVLGGGMSNIDRLYANVPKLWGAWVFSDRVDTRLLRNAHGDSSGVRGAAWLWGAQRARRRRVVRSGSASRDPRTPAFDPGSVFWRAVDRRQSTRLQWSPGGAKLTSGRVPRVRVRTKVAAEGGQDEQPRIV